MPVVFQFPDFPDHKSGPEVIKPFLMLNSADHKILNTHKYKISRNSAFFQAQISQECYFPC